MPSLIPSKLTDEVVSQVQGLSGPAAEADNGVLGSAPHSFARDVNLTEAEWINGIEFVTKVGQFSNETRQEFNYPVRRARPGDDGGGAQSRRGAGETEATLQGPFYVPGGVQAWSSASGAVFFETYLNLSANS
jgi:hypothetical protein